mgnify:FL=1
MARDSRSFAKVFMKTIELPKSSHQSGLHFMRRNPHPKKENHGDCGVRAICLALDLPYNKVWKAATKAKRQLDPKTKATADWSLSKLELEFTLTNLREWDWSYYKIAKGHTSRKWFHADNFPKHCIVLQASHWVCVKDGAIWDSWDSRGSRPKKIEGYFAKQSWQKENFPNLFQD